MVLHVPEPCPNPAGTQREPSENPAGTPAETLVQPTRTTLQVPWGAVPAILPPRKGAGVDERDSLENC